MKPRLRKRLLGLMLPVPLLVAAGCGQKQEGSAAAGAVQTPTGRTAASERANQALLGAAEPFEAVTEQAFAASWDQLDNLIRQGDASVRTIRPELRDGVASAIERQMAALRAARAAGDRIGIALAAVETYRTLVEAQDPGSANPPVAVSLLDYAGFRYDALAQARSPDWREMLRLTNFARQQWLDVAPKVGSRALPGVMDSAIAAMSSAAQRQDSSSARKSAAVELALVDLLEEQVASSPVR